MNEREFKEKAQELVKLKGFELVVKDTTANMTYDGINYFRNVLSFNVDFDGETYITVYLKNDGRVDKVSYINRFKDKAIGMAVVSVLNILCSNENKVFKLKGGRE